MEIPEFIEATGDIEKFYNKELGKFERDQWFQELKNMSLARYRQIIKQVYRQCKFMPKLADIVNIDSELVYSNGIKQEIESVECDVCGGAGVIFYEKIIEDKPYQHVARCNCKNGLNYTYDGTQVNDSRARSKYYIPTLEMINLKGV